MRITPIERMLFALLKSSLLETPAETSPFMGTTDDDWKKCYKLAAEQGVMAVAWEGIQTLPSNLQPPRGLKLRRKIQPILPDGC